jgi:hypothetical protein
MSFFDVTKQSRSNDGRTFKESGKCYLEIKEMIHQMSSNKLQVPKDKLAVSQKYLPDAGKLQEIIFASKCNKKEIILLGKNLLANVDFQ